MKTFIPWFLIVWTYILLLIVAMILDTTISQAIGVNSWWMSALIVIPFWMAVGFPFAEKVWDFLSERKDKTP